MNELFRLLPKLLKDFDDNPKVREAVIFAAWRKIAGETLAEHAVPFQLNKKHLIVAVASERWTKYLKDLSGQMIFKLNSSLSQAAVTFIEFEVNDEFVQAERDKRRSKTYDEAELRELALNQVTPQLRSKADSIKDDYLREQFILAAGSCLARKEKMKNKQ
jgi:hypothetical protein